MPPSTSVSSSPPGASSSSSASTISASARGTRTASRIKGRLSTREHPLELGQHALLGAQVVVGDRLREPLEQVALLAREPARDPDVDDDPQVAGPPARQRR